MYKSKLTNEINKLIEEFGIDDEVDFSDELTNLDGVSNDYNAIEIIYDIIENTNFLINKDKIDDFIQIINQIIIDNLNNDFINSIKVKYSDLFPKDEETLDSLEVKLNIELNKILNNSDEEIDFKNKVKNKPVNYINKRWIDRDEGFHLCRYFKNIPVFNSSDIVDVLYEDIRTRDKSYLGNIMQSRDFQKEYFFLARGPMIKGDQNTIYVINDLGLTISRLPNIERTKRGNVATEVPNLLDKGEVLIAQFRSDDSGHYNIYTTKLSNKQIEFQDLSQNDELLFYFGLSLLIYSKCVRKHEPLYANEYSFLSSIDSLPVIQIFKELEPKVLPFMSENYKAIFYELVKKFIEGEKQKGYKELKLKEYFSRTFNHLTTI